MASPVRKQYLEIKSRYPDALLLYRMGDFYETFDEDARLAARDLEIVLTQRDMGQGEVVPLAGIPYHALDGYLAKLVRKGHRVAIAEQTSEPDGKTLVSRDVVRVVTPGTVIEPGMLDSGANNYLVAVAQGGAESGIAFVDITTGEFAVTQLPSGAVPQEIARLAPSEVLLGESDSTSVPFEAPDCHVTRLNGASFAPNAARRRVLDHFGVRSLDAFGCEGLEFATTAAAVVVDYVGKTHMAALTQLTGLRTYSTDAFMALDPQTRRNLELFEGGRWGVRGQSLLSVLDCTQTPMGTRLLRRWLGQPLLDLDALERRLDAVAWLHASDVRRQRIRAELAEVSDLERAVQRIGTGVAFPRELVGLRRSLERVPALRALTAEAGAELAWLTSELDPCGSAVERVQAAIADDPQGDVGQGRVVRVGYSEEMDEVRMAAQDARSYIAGLERKERERTGIPNLKVGYNRVFGYYLEISNSHRGSVPEDYVRRQTLVNAERFYTQELKEHENRVLSAGDRLQEMETAIYRQVCREVAAHATEILATAAALAALDALLALAETAVRYGYVRPVLDEGERLVLRDARHPVVERFLPSGAFVPNDTDLSTDDNQLVILTGPNMAGKSTYLRQVAVAVLMAQIGSFVPAAEAHVGIVDRIFTRVGLQDDLASGQSTFMVEMVETAAILHHATRRSLVILDEIGRGTSTFDGLSIAQAVAEHIHNAPRLGCRTLFATHYHELTALANRLPRARNLSVAVSDRDGEVVFLHRIVHGGADKSYGVHVAQLAGLPRPLITRAKELLVEHESTPAAGRTRGRRPLPGAPPQSAMPLFGGVSPEASRILAELREMDLDNLTPRQALDKLAELHEQAGEA